MDHRVEARIAALEDEITSLRSLLGGKAEADSDAPTSGRRGMIKLMAVTAVGAVTGAAMLGAQPAAAADGELPLLGEFNDSQSPTIFSTTGNTALIARSDVGYGIEADGGLGNALLAPTGDSPLGIGGNAGTLWVDGSGDWWAATVTDLNNGVWRKLAGASSAGQLHLLPSPVRVYDSRPGQAPEGVGPKLVTVPNEARLIDTTLNDSGVPTTANGVLITLTITGPRSGGFATAWPSGPWPGTSNINFAAGQDIAVSATVGCGAGASILILSNIVTDFLIDVSGYYQ